MFSFGCYYHSDLIDFLKLLERNGAKLANVIAMENMDGRVHSYIVTYKHPHSIGMTVMI